MTATKDHIVVGYDGSQNGRDALALARELGRASGARLVVTFVMRDAMASVAGWEDYQRGAHAAAEHEFNRAAEWLGGDVPLEFDAVPARSAAKGLLEAATRHNASAIVVGSSHRGAVGRALAGSVAQRLLHGAPCPVAVAPVGLAQGQPKISSVIAGYEDTAEGEAAVAAAAVIAQTHGARLRLVSVLDPRVFADYSAYAAAGYESASLKESHRAHLESLIADALAGLPGAVEAAGEVIEGDPGHALAEAARETDLLVLGSRGYGPLRTVLLGSVSSHLLREAPCAVLVAPRGDQ